MFDKTGWKWMKTLYFCKYDARKLRKDIGYGELLKLYGNAKILCERRDFSRRGLVSNSILRFQLGILPTISMILPTWIFLRT